MPNNNPTVTVTYTPSPSTFTFSPDPVPCPVAGNIVFIKQPGNANWNFVNAEVKNDTTHQFTPVVAGNQMHIRNAHTSNGLWGYRVQISVNNGTPFWSPDPQISNVDPGTT